MREPHPVKETEIVAAVESRYGISTAALHFLPLGNDSATSVFRLEASNGTPYFCKLRTAVGFNFPALAVPQFLHASNASHILAPLTTLDNSLAVPMQGFVLALYPFIQDGRTAAAVGLSDSQWHDFGALVRRFHAALLPPDLAALVPREKFIPKDRALFSILEAKINSGRWANDAESALAGFWNSRRMLIQHLVQQVDSLGVELSTAREPYSPCHADMHTFNVLVNPANDFWLVDWDEVILAPVERDLMFVVGGINRALVTPRQTAAFLGGYRGPPANTAMLTYYRFAWAVQDMAAYAQSVFLLPQASMNARWEAVQGFKSLFGPGEIVDIALASASE